MLPIKQNPDKYTGCYRCPDNINNFKIRIKIRRDQEEKWTEKIFSWQEKCADDFLFSYTDEEAYEFDKIQLKLSEKKPEFNYEKMYIMADFGDYFENNWVPNEYPLCTIFYQENGGILRIFPDFSKTYPYSVKNPGFFQYFIENASEVLSPGILVQEQELYNKLIRNHIAIRENSIGKSFLQPPKNKIHVFLFFEILSAKNFENSQIYVKYFLDLPKFWTSKDDSKLKGKTHFGHNFEITLEHDIQGVPKNPTIYFEVISKDYWDVYRTEGIAYQVLPINNPGKHIFDLNCFRFGYNGTFQELRRFFIGDSSNYDDLTWIGIPRDFQFQSQILNKFGVKTVGTGILKIRLNLVHQTGKENPGFSRISPKNSSSLIKSVEEVLLAFKSARKNMATSINCLRQINSS